ncbi:MAG: histidinol-phosphatase [Lachnospiraceae bacterium]|nr:histidinol-phosphatase [Lachnospiraceae bacterium]
MKTIEGYPYLYETHMHTAEGSKCGKCCAKDMVRAYYEAGYAGVIVTDHNWGGNTAVDKSLPWEEWIDQFFQGYFHAKEEGDKLGFPVYLGYEATHGCGHDFLIYGFTIPWMKAHPQLHDATIPEQLSLIHSCGGMVIQAHPYREASYVDEVETFEQYVDGIEMFNAAHLPHKEGAADNSIWNTKAVKLANENHLPGTAGSDQHETSLFGGGVAFPTPLKDLQDYMDRIRGGADYVLTDGKNWYDRQGRKISS